MNNETGVSKIWSRYYFYDEPISSITLEVELNKQFSMDAVDKNEIFYFELYIECAERFAKETRKRLAELKSAK